MKSVEKHKKNVINYSNNYKIDEVMIIISSKSKLMLHRSYIQCYIVIVMFEVAWNAVWITIGLMCIIGAVALTVKKLS